MLFSVYYFYIVDYVNFLTNLETNSV